MQSLGPYDLLRDIGSGGYAKVKLAKHRKTNQTVAIKIIPYNTYEKSREIEKEIATMSSLNHPNICELFDFIKTQNAYFMIMELLDNGSLLEKVNSSGPFSESVARSIFFQLISALLYLKKRKIVHRDIKAENILFDTQRNVRLIDFGFSSGEQTMSEQCGSPSYAAPEMIKGEMYDGMVDVWSCGIVLYVMTVGMLPFSVSNNDDNTQRLFQKIVHAEPTYPSSMSPDLLDLLTKMLIKNPNNRIKIQDIYKHKWLSGAVHPIPQLSELSYDPEVLSSLAKYGFNPDQILADLKAKKKTENTVVYRIALRKKIVRPRSLKLSAPRRNGSNRLSKNSSFSSESNGPKMLPQTPQIFIPTNGIQKGWSFNMRIPGHSIVK